ncbi:SEC14-like protein 1 [Xenia sp. Carnegie-2017]|uniref:SEC14-like protein 1 n=1 Tax=Xenia sp. Carnegie-2017 TaxID=2897299 RepID=UPI001F03A9CB|nr:SEC14-like protein 1 [Xenia sp. Carnegie-2017]
MVQEYQSPVRVYKYPFELVMAAYQKRFPTCKMIPIFLGSEIISESTSEDGAEHIIERRCRINVEAPYLLKKIIGVDNVFFIQKNTTNWRKRTLTINAYNESFSSRVIIKENCYYSVHPENPEWTCYEQEASLDVKAFFNFEAAVEKLMIKIYLSNIKKGKEIIQYYIDELISEGVKDLPRFEDSQGKPRTKSLNEPIAKEESIKIVKSSNPKENEVSVQEGAVSSYTEYKIDDEYIHRYLGALTPTEENALIQLRKRISLTHLGKIPNDSNLLRFLRARDMNIDKAYEMLCLSLAWRRHHDVDKILTEWRAPESALEYYSGGWHHYDKEGRPLYILRLGCMDVKGLLKTVGEDGFLKYVLSINEQAMAMFDEVTQAKGAPISSFTCICDLEGLCLRHLWRPGVKALLRVIEVVEANYPELMGRLLIVRAPRIFGVLWTLVSSFIHENTRKKFLIYSGNDYQAPGGLTDYIPEEYIPKFLGGPCECDIGEGGLVPKSLYRSVEFVERDGLGQEIYHSSIVNKGSPLETVITVKEPESVITWDFDVIQSDVLFTVFRHKRPKEACSGSLTSLGETPSCGVIANVDAVVVERPKICHDGDSIQGTHVCTQAGVYVLQWKSIPLSASLSSRPPSKAKILYFYEVLLGKHFKGSLSSIESSHSGFSQLSLTTQGSHTTASSANSGKSKVSR